MRSRCGRAGRWPNWDVSHALEASPPVRVHDAVPKGRPTDRPAYGPGLAGTPRSRGETKDGYTAVVPGCSVGRSTAPLSPAGPWRGQQGRRCRRRSAHGLHAEGVSALPGPRVAGDAAFPPRPFLTLQCAARQYDGAGALRTGAGHAVDAVPDAGTSRGNSRQALVTAASRARRSVLPCLR